MHPHETLAALSITERANHKPDEIAELYRGIRQARSTETPHRDTQKKKPSDDTVEGPQL
jgi:hypothetical protein